MLKYIVILATALATPAAQASIVSGPVPSSAPIEQPVVKKQKKPKSPRPPMPITPGSQVIEFKDKMKAEIRPDKSVWWFGVNYKKAIMADGKYELMDGQKITTRGGKLVGKMPRPDPKLQPPKPQN